MRRRQLFAGLIGVPFVGFNLQRREKLSPIEQVLYDTLKHHTRNKPKLHSIELIDHPRMVAFEFVYYLACEERLTDSQKKIESRGWFMFVRFPREFKIQMTFDIPKENEKPMGCTDLMDTCDFEKLNNLLGYNVFPPGGDKGLMFQT